MGIKSFLILVGLLLSNFSSLANEHSGVIYINSSNLELLEGYALNVDASLGSNKVVYEKVKIVGRVKKLESQIKIAEISSCGKYCVVEFIEDDSMRERKYYKNDLFHLKTLEVSTGAVPDNGYKETIFMGILFTKNQFVTVFEDIETIDKWISDLNLVLVRENDK